ncbi:MAG: glycosyltransferase family 4 protein [Candidatus Omnitrophica bacterium]|nr:glycosyltransferase family 4 protein [Candidatus Omnitrophota bacterium]
MSRPRLSWSMDARMAFHGGIGTYIRRLTEALLEEESEKHLCLLGWPNRSLHHPQASHRSYSAPIYSVREQMLPPPQTDRSELLHSPHFNIPLRWTGRLAVTIHDLIPIKMPEQTRSRLARPYMRWMLGQIRKKSSAIIAVSEATKQEFCEYTKTPFSRVTVIPHGVHPSVFQPLGQGKIQEARARHQVKTPFILWVSAIRPHKNPETLLRAFSELKRRGAPHQLVMIGQKPDGYRFPIEPAAAECLRNQRRWIADVPDEELPAFYQAASVLAMPSYQEGFGLPALEAMANGLPVVASQIPALTELIGNAGVTIGPDDVDAWSDGLYNVLFDDDRRRNLAELGRKRAGAYTWKKSAAGHLQIFRSLLSADRHRS